jgi:hypothetical protein
MACVVKEQHTVPDYWVYVQTSLLKNVEDQSGALAHEDKRQYAQFFRHRRFKTILLLLLQQKKLIQTNVKLV